MSPPGTFHCQTKTNNNICSTVQYSICPLLEPSIVKSKQTIIFVVQYITVQFMSLPGTFHCHTKTNNNSCSTLQYSTCPILEPSIFKPKQTIIFAVLCSTVQKPFYLATINLLLCQQWISYPPGTFHCQTKTNNNSSSKVHVPFFNLSLKIKTKNNNCSTVNCRTVHVSS